MKKLSKCLSVLTLCFLLIMLSCSKMEFLSIDQTSFGKSSVGGSSSSGVDRTDPGGIGKFVYKQLRLHVFHFDPYQLIPLEQRALLKQKFDELKANPNKDYHNIWQEASQSKLVSNELAKAVIQFHEGLDQLVKSSVDIDSTLIDKWFANQLAFNLERKDLLPADNDFLMRHESIIRYALKAYIEALPKRIESASSRARLSSDNCGKQQFDCYGGYIGTYAGIGAIFTPDHATGGVVGIIVGTVVALFNCHCEQDPCSSPTYVSSDGNDCYNSNVGLPLVAGGYGTNAQGFRWEVYKSDNMIPANLISNRLSGDHVTIPDSEIQGNPVVYVRAYTNCSGPEYGTTKLLKIDLQYTLGWPDFYMTGPTSAPVGSNTTYGLNGVNLDNVQWNIWTYNQGNGVFTYSSNNAATIHWNNIPGYVHVTATATTSCGTDTDGVYVQTQ